MFDLDKILAMLYEAETWTEDDWDCYYESLSAYEEENQIRELFG